jgi:hypothetical protein
MRILLVGEYNRAHYNIKLGLEELGHTAKVMGLADGFKKVQVDHPLINPFESGLLKKLRVAFVRLFNIDLQGWHLKYQLNSLKKDISDFDVVQFINEAPFGCDRKTQKQLIARLISWNANPFLLSCGTDLISVKYAYDKKLRYSILTPYFDGKGKSKDYASALSYLKEEHYPLHQFLFKEVLGVVANDLDYHLPMLNHPKYLGMIPHAINLKKLKYEEAKIDGPLVIFHGINTYNYYKKGNDLFEAALQIIASKYGDSVEIITTRNLPYKDYIEAFNKCHILMDQVFAYDQGYNALEAMAKGKVVFTGAEQEFLDYYGLKENEVAINALPDVDDLIKKIEWLINHPDEIVAISKRARAFVEQHHDHIECAKQYLQKWQSVGNFRLTQDSV